MRMRMEEWMNGVGTGTYVPNKMALISRRKDDKEGGKQLFRASIGRHPQP